MGWFNSSTDDDEREQFIGRLLDANELLVKELPDEILDQLSRSLAGQPVREISGNWIGLVDGNNQIVRVKQSGSMINLEGKFDHNPEIGFRGNGRLLSDVLVFSWITTNPDSQGSAVGVNVMTLSTDGRVLDGKYFGSHGAVGPERYEKAGAE